MKYIIAAIILLSLHGNVCALTIEDVCNPVYLISEKYNSISKNEYELERGEFEKIDDYKKRTQNISRIASDSFIFGAVPFFEDNFKYDIDKEKYFFEYSSFFGYIDIITEEGEEDYILKKKAEIKYGIRLYPDKKFINKKKFSFNFYINSDIAQKYKRDLMFFFELSPILKDKTYTLFESNHGLDDKFKIKRLINVQLKRIFIVGKYDNEVLACIPGPMPKPVPLKSQSR